METPHGSDLKLFSLLRTLSSLKSTEEAYGIGVRVSKALLLDFDVSSGSQASKIAVLAWARSEGMLQ